MLASVFKAFDKNNSVTSLYVLFVCALHQYHAFSAIIFTAVHSRRPFLLPYIPAAIFTAVYSRGYFYSRTFPPVIFTAVRFRRPFLQPYIPAGHFSAVRFRRSFLQPYIPAAIFTAVRFRGHSYCLTLKCTPSCSAIFLQFSIFSSPITSTTLRMVYIPSAAAERAKSSIML